MPRVRGQGIDTSRGRSFSVWKQLVRVRNRIPRTQRLLRIRHRLTFSKGSIQVGNGPKLDRIISEGSGIAPSHRHSHSHSHSIGVKSLNLNILNFVFCFENILPRVGDFSVNKIVRKRGNQLLHTPYAPARPTFP